MGAAADSPHAGQNIARRIHAERAGIIRPRRPSRLGALSHIFSPPSAVLDASFLVSEFLFPEDDLKNTFSKYKNSYKKNNHGHNENVFGT